MTDRFRVQFLGVACLALAGVLFTALPTSGKASAKVFRIGLLANTIPLSELTGKASSNPLPRRLEDGLRKRGWIDGRNVRLIWRSAEGDLSRLPLLARELVALEVDVLVAWGHGIAPVMQATSSIPIVMGSSGFLVREGRNTPARNVTGLTLVPTAELTGKRLGILKEIAPAITRVAFISDTSEAFDAETALAARRLGLSLLSVGYGAPDRLEQALDDAVRQGANAIVVTEGLYLHTPPAQRTLHKLAAKHRLPMLHYNLTAAETGGLLAYGPDIADLHDRVSYFVDRVLRGARPQDIPIEQPARLELRINRRAAAEIGLRIPGAVLAQANRVID